MARKNPEMSIFLSVPSFLRSRAPVTPDSSPSTSAVLCSNSTSMLGVSNTRCCIAFEARRWGLRTIM